MKYLSIIEEYFSDNLKDVDLENFKQELKTNAELREEFKIYKRAIDFVISQENGIGSVVKKLKDYDFNPALLLDIQKYLGTKPTDENEEQLLKTIHNENHRIIQKFKFRSYFIRWSKVAAMITILIGIGIIGFIIVPKVTMSDEDLFEEFYSPYSQFNNRRSIDREIDFTLKEGLSSYIKGDYRIALLKFNAVPDSLKLNPEFFIAEGVSFIEVKEYYKAIDVFKKIHEDNLVYSISLWYQGLCYIKIGDKKAAKEIFNVLKNYEPYYLKKTKKLLRYL